MKPEMQTPERIPPEQIQDLKQRLDLREIAGMFTTLHGGREQYGPCPRCGGEDRFHVQSHAFFCRNCYPPEAGRGRHDVFDFAEFVGQARGFREAYEVVAGWANSTPFPVRPMPSQEAGIRHDGEAWQTRARLEVNETNLRLSSAKGRVGQVYLARRGIVPATWQTAQLGLASRKDAEGRYGWSISLPWFYEHQVTAIQYRFIEPHAQRYTRFSFGQDYGETILYTLPLKQSNILVLVEGEFNALSIWQATPYDAVSFGSQNMSDKTVAAIRKAVGEYERVLVWADEPAVAQDLVGMMDRSAKIISHEHDANELLQQGQLRDFWA